TVIYSYELASKRRANEAATTRYKLSVGPIIFFRSAPCDTFIENIGVIGFCPRLKGHLPRLNCRLPRLNDRLPRLIRQGSIQPSAFGIQPEESNWLMASNFL